MKKIQYNSPVVLTFALLSLAALVLNRFTNGYVNAHFFSVYRSDLLSVPTYIRLFCHVLGHSSYEHFISNMLLLLVLGPQLEEKYGSRRILIVIALTAAVSGIVHMIFAPVGTSLLGASGIVFMMIVLSSLGGMKSGKIPLTLIFVLIFYLGQEVVDILKTPDNVSHLTHIIGGLCGAAAGFIMPKRKV